MSSSVHYLPTFPFCSPFECLPLLRPIASSHEWKFPSLKCRMFATWLLKSHIKSMIPKYFASAVKLHIIDTQ
jgi:hypothetical protein